MPVRASRPPATGDSAVQFEAREGHVVGAGGVQGHLGDSEVAEPFVSNMRVYVFVDAHRDGASFLAQLCGDSRFLVVIAPVEFAPETVVGGGFEDPTL